jgi:arsenical pump membrane protein
MTDIALLAAGVIGALASGRRLPRAIPPLLAVVAALALRRIDPHAAFDAARPLAGPLAFLLCSIPLAVLLDEAGCFDAAAALGGGVASLWATAALAVAVLNLDAAVVLVTPVAIAMARRRGADPIAYSLVPALVACLGSSLLPVSNLTNLTLAPRVGATTLDFVRELGPSTLAALVVGFVMFRVVRRDRSSPAPGRPRDRRALVTGAIVILALVAGFATGAAPWAVALVVGGALACARRRLPLRSVPWLTAVLAASLAVLAAIAARHLPVSTMLAGGDVRRVGAFALTANVVNNLPAVLIARSHLHGGDPRVWSVLLGANAGPVVLITASLSNLLWLESARRVGLEVRARDFTSVGVLVGLPALAAATAVLVVVRG